MAWFALLGCTNHSIQALAATAMVRVQAVGSWPVNRKPLKLVQLALEWQNGIVLFISPGYNSARASVASYLSVMRELQRLINDEMKFGFGKGVQVTVIREGGPFDQGPFIPLRNQGEELP